jgi:hypothetical protein
VESYVSAALKYSEAGFSKLGPGKNFTAVDFD